MGLCFLQKKSCKYAKFLTITYTVIRIKGGEQVAASLQTFNTWLILYYSEKTGAFSNYCPDSR